MNGTFYQNEDKELEDNQKRCLNEIFYLKSWIKYSAICFYYWTNLKDNIEN